MGVVNAACNAEAQARISLQKGVERGTVCSLRQPEGGLLASTFPNHPEQVLRASEGTSADRDTFIRNLVASQPVLIILV